VFGPFPATRPKGLRRRSLPAGTQLWRIDAEGELSEEEERRLFEHYSVQYTAEGTTTEQGGTATAQGHTRPGRGDSDEQLGTAAEQGHTRPGRGVRLRKYVATEDQGAG